MRSLTDRQLIEILLGPRVSTEEVDDLTNKITLAEAALVYGSSPTRVAGRARKIAAAVELGRRVALREVMQTNEIINNADKVAPLARLIVGNDEREHFMVFSLDTQNRLKHVEVVAIGSLNSCIVHPREVYYAPMSYRAASVILAHNHPSGDTEPSGQDIQLTRRLIKAGDILGIELLDHVIIGKDETYTSIRDLGLM
jgi:DNA repair protein RadC